MENMEKGLTVLKWVLIFRPKIPRMSQNFSVDLSAQSMRKGFNWVSVVRGKCTHVRN